MTMVIDLRAMQQYLESLQEGIPLDEVGSEAYVKIMGAVRQIFTTPGLLELVHEYQQAQRETE